VTYPHESWVLDEEADLRVARLCDRYGVRHFSRRDIPKWNQPGPPYQAKTKAGNVNAWLFRYGRQYEFFVQMDIDHNPRPDYLHRVLGHFQDRRVAWVQAPSVYGNMESWTARGSAEQELVLQGPLQSGFYGFSETPFIIGSHSTYRTAAMLEIGGMQPTRAEDHLDTVVLAQHGHVGVFVPEQIATGQGPESFDTYLSQQFAWAFSMIQVLFRYAPRYVTRYRPRTALQFLFVQTWYPLWSLSMLFLFLLPSLLLLLDRTMASIPLGGFLVAYLPIPLLALAIWWWSSRWFQPAGLRLSWRGIVLHIARWPVVLWALINVVCRIKRPYMITPKGTERGATRHFNVRAQAPYLLLILPSLAVSWWFMTTHRHGPAQGYLLFSLEGALGMLLVFWVALRQDMLTLRREGLARAQVLTMRLRPLIVGLLTLTLASATTLRALPLIAQAATWDGSAAVASSPTASGAASVRDVWNGPPASIIVPAVPQTTNLRRLIADGRFTGAFDPGGTLLGPGFQTEMIYINLSDQSIAGLSGRLEGIVHSGRIPVVTLEPWPLTA
ncbi:MAG TPA: glycosyltransferase family 2 protein, partial [Chloroflexota bacterium]|nr:glycosyltransferase family 2 protein [Chloroflexota bacterium]